jgi:hypothetical protein
MIGELTKLLEQGYLATNHVVKTPAGEYIFKIKTLSPKDEVEARLVAEQKAKLDQIEVSDPRYYLYMAIEFVARCVESVNESPIEKIPGVEGETVQEKRKSFAQKLSSTMLQSIWKEYNNLQEKALKEFENITDEQVKK